LTSTPNSHDYMQSHPDSTTSQASDRLRPWRSYWSFSGGPLEIDHSTQTTERTESSSPSTTLWDATNSSYIDEDTLGLYTGASSSLMEKNNGSSTEKTFPHETQSTSNEDKNLHNLGSSELITFTELLKEPRCYEHGYDGRLFSSASNLKRHQRERDRMVRQMLCSWCDAAFYRRWTRDHHVPRLHCRSPHSARLWHTTVTHTGYEADIMRSRGS
jgi:hypothetical protein